MMKGSRDKSISPAAFTLIELLGAIMVLTVLVVMILPAFRSMHSATLRQRAAVQAAEIAQAALAYRKEYGIWPMENEAEGSEKATALLAACDGVYMKTPENGSDSQGTRHLELAEVANLLRGLTPRGEVPDSPEEGNPRNISFLELPASCFSTDDTKGNLKKGTPLDPWGRPFVLVLSRPATHNGTQTHVGRVEGGVCASIRSTNETFYIDLPDEAVAFSWGDPLMQQGDSKITTTSSVPARVIGSWSLR